MTIITRTTSSPIQQFYTGQTVFITGGTGFLGKVLIEKLLRSCPDIASIYILMRPKKGFGVNERLESLFDSVIFQRLKDEFPKFRHKVIAVAGDCKLPGLGLSPSDKQTILRETSIVFNVAATIRFDEDIQDAVAINIQGTKETLNLCKNMQELMAVIHVSTAYSNCTRSEIDEKIYDSPICGDDLMKLVQITDKNSLKAMTKSLLQDFPNTYAFTKQIAEQVVRQYGKGLPVGIFRPAIVVSAYKEPLEGWIDNFFGPTGAMAGCGVGLIHTLHVDESCPAELVPVDFTVNALIASAWDVASNKNEVADPPIYNYVSSWNKSFTWGEYMNIAFQYGITIPSVHSVWCISLMPSWRFKNDATMKLWDRLTAEDRKLFYFSMINFDWQDYIEKSLIGLRLYILNDHPSTIPAAKSRIAKFIFFQCCIKYAFIGLAAGLVYYVYRFAVNF